MGSVSVDRDIGVPIPGHLDGGPDLIFTERRHVERAARRGDTAAAHQFDMGRALQELLADALLQ